MIQLGRTQQLKVESLQQHGAYLVDAGADLPPLPAAYNDIDLEVKAERILLPTNQLEGEQVGDLVQVFQISGFRKKGCRATQRIDHILKQ